MLTLDNLAALPQYLCPHFQQTTSVCCCSLQPHDHQVTSTQAWVGKWEGAAAAVPLVLADGSLFKWAAAVSIVCGSCSLCGGAILACSATTVVCLWSDALGRDCDRKPCVAASPAPLCHHADCLHVSSEPCNSMVIWHRHLCDPGTSMQPTSAVVHAGCRRLIVGGSWCRVRWQSVAWMWHGRGCRTSQHLCALSQVCFGCFQSPAPSSSLASWLNGTHCLHHLLFDRCICGRSCA